MAAPTSIATRLFKLANGGPSTHGPKTFAADFVGNANNYVWDELADHQSDINWRLFHVAVQSMIQCSASSG